METGNLHLFDRSSQIELLEQHLHETEQALASLRAGQVDTVLDYPIAEAYLFRQLAESTSASIFILQDQQIRYANPAAAALTGYGRHQLLELEFWQLAHPDYRKVLLTGGIGQGWSKHIPVRYELKFLSANGREHWVDLTIGRLTYAGQPAWIVTAFDISERDLAERRLEEKDRYLQAIFDQSSQFMGLLDVDGVLLEANQTALKFAGQRRGDVIGRYFWETPWWQHSSQESERLKRAVQSAAGGQFVRYEAQIADASGEITDIDFSIQPVLDERGQVEFLIPEGRRLAQRNTILPVRHTSQEVLLRTALEAAGHSILITDQKGMILWANPAFSRVTGYSLEEILGFTPRFLNSGIHPPKFFQDMWQRILAGEVWHGEMTNRRKDGSLYIEEQTIAPVLDHKNQISHFIAIKIDISERKRLEDLLARNAAQAMALSEVSHALAEASLELHSVLQTVAQSSAQLVDGGCEIRLLSEDQQRLSLATFFYPDLQDQLQVIERYLKAAEYPVDRSPLRRVTLEHLPLITSLQELFGPEAEPSYLGETIGPILLTMQVLVVPLIFQGELIGTLSAIRKTHQMPFTQEDVPILQSLADRAALAIASARQHEQIRALLLKEQKLRTHLVQTEKFTALGRMLASVAHEINNPLQTIKNCLFLTQGALEPNSQAQEFLGMAVSETHRISNLVTQLREIYRPTDARQMKPIEMRALIRETYALLSPHLKRNLVNWQGPPPGEPVFVCGVSDQLKQVFFNLSFNAIEAMQPDGGKLFVDLESFPDQKLVAIYIRDTGPGIRGLDLEKIFEPFYTTKDFGTGLGLSITFEIVQRHNGRIDIKNWPEGGAIFTIWLPITISGEPCP